MRLAHVGVLLDRQAAKRRWENGLNVFQTYIGEILGHAGISFQWLDRAEQISQKGLDVLVVALDGKEEETASEIWKFAEEGGVVISFMGLSRLADKLGYSDRGPAGKGYAMLPAKFADQKPLRYLQASPWLAVSTSDHVPGEIGKIKKDHPDGDTLGAALLQFRVGKGVIDRWAVDIAETVVKFQQGAGPVIEDGIPALDGTGPVDDGILKADDAIEMDWELDREKTGTGAPYFAHAYADLWREVLIGHLLRRVVERGLTLPVIGYWPDGISHVAMISLDSDHNTDESAEVTADVLGECDTPATWCIIEPGYSAHIYKRVEQEGHELAFHYNAVHHDQGKWEEAEFRRQFEWLKTAVGMEKITSNKNHYTRFEGWGELFRWCETYGILSDQTRGPSKKGNIGFLFGTCHPYFPVGWSDEQNRIYDVLEISFLTQDLDHRTLADSSVIGPFLEQVEKVGGVAHFLFHPVHIYNQKPVRHALRKVVREAKQRGFVFWTGKQINDWERARRKIRIEECDGDGHILVQSETDLSDVVVWVPLPDENEAEPSDSAQMRFGVRCAKKVVTVQAKQRRWV
ncbi:hypothetical protein ACFO25_17790 [Paenactinomyces guangxiensis]|uniref:Uncharacterized protein n=1 Tax=Paenactinomyces guangxiensis TaxID=1490290 RepID=A0A7W1WRK9_9BACL|nr:hypothetical protein [Paenactinomyces guangxiensis]MBA4494683.1 hypothetical protein [Paenactinomyces guangxiensis]MBH8591767.1 hypothetical protein [Paenactinomyces guangxiensis]